MTIELEPIGIIHTPYKQKFAIPRQPGLAKDAIGSINFNPHFNDPNCLRGIEQFSHLWLIFQFHQTVKQGWSPLIRPPRLGGNEKIGVFASRSTFRPNGLGLSVVNFESVSTVQGQVVLTVSGVDLLDGTPILDIKPYIPYADSLPDANAGFAQRTPQSDMQVCFNDEAQIQLVQYSRVYPKLRELICQVLGQDPRPAYKQSDSQRIFGMNLYELNIRWQVSNNINTVLSIAPEQAEQS